MKKQNKGITLVALVITIIILLILAGITINSLTGSGLFEKAKLAKEKSENADKLENETLGGYSNTINEFINGSRQTVNIEEGPTVIWSYENDSNGALINAGTTDGTSERKFADNYNVSDFDAVIIDAGYPPARTDWPYLQSLYISKIDFDKEILGTLSHASNWSMCGYIVKIDTANNKIVFINSGEPGYITIKQVIGIKY